MKQNIPNHSDISGFTKFQLLDPVVAFGMMTSVTFFFLTFFFCVYWDLCPL